MAVEKSLTKIQIITKKDKQERDEPYFTIQKLLSVWVSMSKHELSGLYGCGVIS